MTRFDSGKAEGVMAEQGAAETEVRGARCQECNGSGEVLDDDGGIECCQKCDGHGTVPIELRRGMKAGMK